MANINHLEMAGAFSALPQISIKKSFFGLKTNIIYTTTQSSIQIIQEEYDTTNGKLIVNLLLCSQEKLVAEAGKQNIAKASIGKMRLDVCISEDKQFIAAQLLQFVDLNYVPITDMKVFEGKAAEAFAQAIA